MPDQDHPRKRPFMLLTKPLQRYFFRRRACSAYGRYCGAVDGL